MAKLVSLCIDGSRSYCNTIGRVVNLNSHFQYKLYISTVIQCEFCCCWQHAECCKYTDGELPDRYICFICLNTPGARESCRYLYNQDWLRKGKFT